MRNIVPAIVQLLYYDHRVGKDIIHRNNIQIRQGIKI